MNKIIFFLISLMLFTSLSAQDEYSTRSMMKRTVFFVKTDGAIQSADYWSMPLGSFDYSVSRKIPGEGDVMVTGSANLNFICSGYIEGAGFSGDYEIGKMMVKANFAVVQADTLKLLQLSELDYVYMGAKKVKLIGATEEQDLFVTIETDKKYVAKKLGIGVYWKDPQWGELQHKEDVNPIIGFSFTKEGAQRAWIAAKKAAGM